MSLFGRHPGLGRLARFTDGATGESEARKIQEHLGGCVRCRRELGFLFELRRTARDMAHPAPPKGTLEEILRRRAEGERVILPLSAPPPPRASPTLAGLLLGLLGLGGVIGALLLGFGEARAGASRLAIGPERPQLGQPLAVEFRAASRLAAEERVVLRGLYRGPEAEPISPSGPLGAAFRLELERSGDAVFSGTAWLPPSAAYAVFVVESPDGNRIESDAGRPWEVLVHDAEGRPLLAALAERYRLLDVMGRPHEALETALRMTELYPAEPVGWNFRLASELRLSAPGGADSIREAHRDRLYRLGRILSRGADPGAERLAALHEYARRLGEAGPARHWERRLLEEHPRHPAAQRSRILSIVAASRDPSGDPGEHLRALELEWDRAGAMDRSLLNMAFGLALATGDPAKAGRWAERYVRFHPEDGPAVAARLLRLPEHRAPGMEIARRLLARLESPPPEERPLLLPPSEHRRLLEERRRRLLAALGGALLAEGKVAAALDTLTRAAREGWDPDLFGELGRLRVTAGDTAGGLALFGMVAADPLTGGRARGEARSALGAPLSDGEWAGWVERGRAELERRLAAVPARRPSGGPIRVTEAGGAEVRLDRRLEDRVSLLAFWVADLHEADRLEGLTAGLEEAGAAAIPLWTGSPPPDAAGAGPAALGDSRQEASEAFSAWVRPWYVVLDREGLIRYEGRSLDRAARHALVLAEARARAE